MCGVYGFIGKPTKKTATALRKLGLLNESRGRDSAGLAVVKDDEYRFMKKAINASTFFENKDVIDALSSLKSSEFVNVIGHTRAATRGAVIDKNAHPFRIGRILMAHNGCIANFDILQDRFKVEYQVDSQIIGYLLNIKEPLEVFEKILSGWFTVPFIDLEDPKTLWIGKSIAPLSMAVLPDGSGVYFSSDKADLKKALDYAGIRCGVGTAKGDKLYKFEYKNGKISRSRVKFFNYVEEEDSQRYRPWIYGSKAYEDKSSNRWVKTADGSWMNLDSGQKTASVAVQNHNTLDDYLDSMEQQHFEELDRVFETSKKEIAKESKEAEKRLEAVGANLLTAGQASGSTSFRMTDDEMKEWYEKLRAEGKLKKKYKNRPFESLKDYQVSKVVQGKVIPTCDCLLTSKGVSHDSGCAFFKGRVAVC